MSFLKLFQPTKVGRMTLQHRLVLAPLTRNRIDKEGVPILPIVADYYAQRASTSGTFLITEGTMIAREASGADNFPGIWSDEQIASWKKITESVHARGSYIYLQLGAFGRSAMPDVLSSKGIEYVAPSAVPLSYQPTPPRALTTEEVKEYVQLFAKAASNAVHLAGFDGVEIHGANGYFVDQFVQDISNHRTDEYGGSVENRARFALEVLEAVAKEVGADRTAIRLSPWNTFQDMRMADPKPTFAHLVLQIKERLPDLAYLHVTEPRVASEQREAEDVPEEEENDFLRKIWAPRPFISAGGYTRDLAIEAAERGDIVAVGRHFIANPDLPVRWKEDLPLNRYDRSTFYVPGDASGKGYLDYPFVDGTTSIPPAVTEKYLVHPIDNNRGIPIESQA
ncbi:NADH:flavin oxidoreductase/NADH oxidase [Pleurotus eryngii]|uniref:NADH:flavin oxidoreductase/NADH oxidase n=1 Tax=Pleurotus eryngii TaxID=5323 RepID=A0A9P6DI48_PLEER|nr:NADH:flavin oxidoreductase/NADH oxidase [Pleurotus eryngii]